jgi:hypothetical protein
MPKKRNNRPDVSGLMPEVDEEMRTGRGQSSPEEDDKPTKRQNDLSTRQQDNKSVEEESRSPLEKQLEVLMEGPDGPFSESAPDLKARANGYLSEEVEKALQQATSVLKNRYDSVSKSMIMNFAIQVVLWDLREHAEESQVVSWLESLGE